MYIFATYPLPFPQAFSCRLYIPSFVFFQPQCSRTYAFLCILCRYVLAVSIRANIGSSLETIHWFCGECQHLQEELVRASKTGIIQCITIQRRKLDSNRESTVIVHYTQLPVLSQYTKGTRSGLIMRTLAVSIVKRYYSLW